MKKASQRILVIVGPTASGKSDLAIALARKYDGEIISADSRQVYIGMDIGTGKVTKREQAQIPHHLLDITRPNQEYNVSYFLRDAKKAIQDIEKRGKLPIICGGTAFWIEALVLGTPLPPIPPDKEFRERWGLRPATELFAYLKRLDPERAKTIDRKNKVRLLRAIEIATVLGKVPPMPKPSAKNAANFTFVGLNPPVEELNKKIRDRLRKRMREGMEKEVGKLFQSGVSWKRLEEFGLEYRTLARLLQGKITPAEMIDTLPFDIIHYAKRQRSSLRRLEKKGVKIKWFESPEQALAEFSL
ncbi:MAG: tRNA (adenosine(37)-N6)-dimethylallyltransferase MiaA [Candidatus Moraniibacteriota bacterium]